MRARAETDLLFDLIDPETIYARPIQERHRLIFYLGHFEAFDWNLLARRSKSEKAFRPEFDTLFERGIDPPLGKAPADSASDWPGRGEVDQYRARTRGWIDRHLNELDCDLLQMAIEHRQMHAETFAYLMHNLPYDKKRASAAPLPSSTDVPGNPMVTIEAGETVLGKTRGGFGWDNEYAAHTVQVPAFGITKFKITNGEYLAFVREGGPIPNFWAREGDRFYFRGMFERYPLPLGCPAWVTWNQADSFAKWRGSSLPSEAQYQRAAAQAAPDANRDNFDNRGWDPVSVYAQATNDGVPSQMVGNGWEWTNDVFAPFEGFEAHPFYPGYSADFFDGEHYVMKGASPRTAALLTRPSFRNWFRPEYPYMYAGFRLMRND